MHSDWQPSASLITLQLRNTLLQVIRQYFVDSKSLEVQTPALSRAAATDPYIDSYSTEEPGRLWLHTSPEFPMKRLLAAYRVDIHQLATVFRQDESGRHHNREFLMLEWYRVQYDLNALIQDAVDLINTCCTALKKPELPVRVVSYVNQVKELCGEYPEQLSVADIAAVFKAQGRSFPKSLLVGNTVDDALTLLIDEFVVRKFSAKEITALTEYPVSQASLAGTGVNAQGQSVALRAEIFIGSVELANGFEELTDAQEQQKRFEADNNVRKTMGKVKLPYDERLIAALRYGLPQCAGMAMGIDRLFMVLGGYSRLSDVMAFADSHA